MSEEATPRYIPLEVLREDRISFPLNGSDLSVKQAKAEDFFTFISGAVNVVNVNSWSIFMRWNAINVALEAGTLTVSRAEDRFTLAFAEVKAEDFSTSSGSSELAQEAG